MKQQGFFWNDCTPSARHNAGAWAASDRGWLMAVCDRKTYGAVYDEQAKQWREPSSLGSYLDYGPEHFRTSHEYCKPDDCHCRISQPGNIHCVVYTPGNGVRPHCYVETVAQAHAWIEAEAAKMRPDVFRAAAEKAVAA